MFKRIIGISVLVGAFLLTGCGGGAEAPMPQLLAAQSIGDGYTCKGASCKNDWVKTQLWIHKHSKTKIQIANDIIIQTHSHKDAFSFAATKEPIGNSTYKIKLELSGGSMYTSGNKKRQLEKTLYYYLKTGKDLLVPVPTTSFIDLYMN